MDGTFIIFNSKIYIFEIWIIVLGLIYLAVQSNIVLMKSLICKDDNYKNKGWPSTAAWGDVTAAWILQTVITPA